MASHSIINGSMVLRLKVRTPPPPSIRTLVTGVGRVKQCCIPFSKSQFPQCNSHRALRRISPIGHTASPGDSADLRRSKESVL